MDVQQVVKTIEDILLNRQLTPIENFVFIASWGGKTYNQMKEESNYGSPHLKDIGSNLWQELSEVIGDKVTKKNLQLTLSNFLTDTNLSTETKSSTFEAIANSSDRDLQAAVFVPTLPIVEDFSLAKTPDYIPRPQLEGSAVAEIEQLGGLLRISAPQKMGKSYLIARIIATARNLGYKTILLDLKEADSSKFENLDRFLRWFCLNISLSSGVPLEFDEYWHEEIGSQISCRLYFERFILPHSTRPLVIAIENLHRVFEYPLIAGDFLPMLRHWHERAKYAPIWQRMRLVVTQSTEVYVPLKLNQSPFNVGLSIRLPPFNLEETKALATQYEIEWTRPIEQQQLQCLSQLVGGHPYLLSMAFDRLSRQQITPTELIHNAATPAGIYSNFLRGYLVSIKQHPELIAVMHELLSAEESIQINAIAAYKLHSLGLIVLQGDRAQISCQLYRDYFQQQLNLLNTVNEPEQSVNLAGLAENLLENIDLLTLLPNKDYLLYYLTSEWQEWSSMNVPLSLIVCDLDHFQLYNEIYGYIAGDACLQLVANKIQDVLQNWSFLVSRYEGQQFIIVLPHTECETAEMFAELIRQEIKKLEIVRDRSEVVELPEKIITVSLGVANIQPSIQTNPMMLITKAQDALSEAKHQGRDGVIAITVNAQKNN